MYLFELLFSDLFLNDINTLYNYRFKKFLQYTERLITLEKLNYLSIMIISS